MDRPPVLHSELCVFNRLPTNTKPKYNVDVWKLDFNVEYDVDDLKGKDRAEEIKQNVRSWKEEHPFVNA